MMDRKEQLTANNTFAIRGVFPNDKSGQGVLRETVLWLQKIQPSK